MASFQIFSRSSGGSLGNEVNSVAAVLSDLEAWVVSPDSILRFSVYVVRSLSASIYCNDGWLPFVRGMLCSNQESSSVLANFWCSQGDPSSSKAEAEVEVKSSELVIKPPPLSLTPPTKNTRAEPKNRSSKLAKNSI